MEYIDGNRGVGRCFEMLRVYYGEMPEAVYHTSVYFKNVYSDEWFAEPIAKKIIKEIDKSEVIDRRLIESKVLGRIPPADLSHGTKTLLLMYNCPETVFNASACGDNCAPWILEIAKLRDITINLHHIMNFGDNDFEIEILNCGKRVHNMAELALIAGLYLG